MSWIRNFSYGGVEFHLMGDWYGLEGLKLCLSIGCEDIQSIIESDPERVIDGIRFFMNRAQEIMFAGWASDGVFWHYASQDRDLDELRSIVNIVLNSEFSSDKAKEFAIDYLDWIKEQEKKIVKKQAKRDIVTRRRSDFAKERDRLMLALIERDGYECAECGETEGLSIDHVIPLSKGGSDELDNLQLLCKGCNSSKKDKMPEA